MCYLLSNFFVRDTYKFRLSSVVEPVLTESAKTSHNAMVPSFDPDAKTPSGLTGNPRISTQSIRPDMKSMPYTLSLCALSKILPL
jgi:hypothetical protein